MGIEELRKELIEQRDKNKLSESKIKELNNTVNKLKENNKELEQIINEQKQEIIDYMLKLNNLSINEQDKLYKPEDKIISISFKIQDSKDIFNYSCKITDLFVKLEQRLYIDFPKYRKVETYFMANKKRILRFQTLEENGIKNNDIISLYIFKK